MKPLNNSQKYVEIAEKESYNDVRKSFLSHISHGIRTPLNSIMGFSRLLMDRQMIDGKPKEYAQRIIYSSNILLSFVESVIELSQYESNTYEVKIQKVNLTDLLWTVAETFMIKRHEQNLSEVDLSVIGLMDKTTFEPTIVTDYELVKKSVYRLVNMAAKSIKSGKLELGFETISSNELTIYVRMADNCILNNLDNDLDIDDDINTFEAFNYEVLTHSVKMIGGKVNIDSLINQFSIELPINNQIKDDI